jgi:hypothetical protein
MTRSVRGTIALVQENRFQLVDRDGTSHLLTLDHRVSLLPSDLRKLWRSGEPVLVELRDAPELIGAVATSIQPLSSTEYPQ